MKYDELEFVFENGDSLTVSKHDIVLVDIKKKRASSKVIVINKKVDFDRVLQANDICHITIRRNNKKVGRIKLAWVSANSTQTTSMLQRARILPNGNLLIGFKGNDTEGSPDEWFNKCFEYMSSDVKKIPRVKPKKLGMCRKYSDYNVPFLKLKLPKHPFDMMVYIKRIWEFYKKEHPSIALDEALTIFTDEFLAVEEYGCQPIFDNNDYGI